MTRPLSLVDAGVGPATPATDEKGSVRGSLPIEPRRGGRGGGDGVPVHARAEAALRRFGPRPSSPIRADAVVAAAADAAAEAAKLGPFRCRRCTTPVIKRRWTPPTGALDAHDASATMAAAAGAARAVRSGALHDGHLRSVHEISALGGASSTPPLPRRKTYVARSRRVHARADDARGGTAAARSALDKIAGDDPDRHALARVRDAVAEAERGRRTLGRRRRREGEGRLSRRRSRRDARRAFPSVYVFASSRARAQNRGHRRRLEPPRRRDRDRAAGAARDRPGRERAVHRRDVRRTSPPSPPRRDETNETETRAEGYSRAALRSDDVHVHLGPALVTPPSRSRRERPRRGGSAAAHGGGDGRRRRGGGAAAAPRPAPKSRRIARADPGVDAGARRARSRARGRWDARARGRVVYFSRGGNVQIARVAGVGTPSIASNSRGCSSPNWARSPKSSAYLDVVSLRGTRRGNHARGIRQGDARVREDHSRGGAHLPGRGRTGAPCAAAADFPPRENVAFSPAAPKRAAMPRRRGRALPPAPPAVTTRRSRAAARRWTTLVGTLKRKPQRRRRASPEIWRGGRDACARPRTLADAAGASGTGVHARGGLRDVGRRFDTRVGVLERGDETSPRLGRAREPPSMTSPETPGGVASTTKTKTRRRKSFDATERPNHDVEIPRPRGSRGSRLKSVGFAHVRA